MKVLTATLALVLTVFSASAQTGKPASSMPATPGKPVLKTAQDSASYAYGLIMAQSLKRQLTNDLSQELVIVGLNAVLRGDTALAISQQDAQKVYGEYNRQIQAKAGEGNRMEGQKFLETNKKRSGVTTTASGLQYEVMKKGTGTVAPLPTDKVKVHYHGTLINGEVFDSSVDRGQPAQFGLNQVIKGWTEGLQLMKAGDKFKFFIPYELAYGERSAGPKIKPFSTLIFEVELLEIVK